MESVLPSRVMNYSVSSKSPTEELLTLGQILSEVGDYASTILDREHLSLSRKCGTRLRKVVCELVSRESIESVEELYDMPEYEIADNDLSTMTIGELHSLYRRWPIRHQRRMASGREHLTFYYENRIVRELLRRKASGKVEQLKIDYCVATYNNELENLSFILSVPVQTHDDKIFPDITKVYTPDELLALIRLYSGYKDVTEREILVEYVDFALDMQERNGNIEFGLSLLTELAEIGRRKIICVPDWVRNRLEKAIQHALATKTEKEAELVPAMLTLQMLNGDMSLTSKIRRIVNRYYKSAFDNHADLGERIENLHTAVMCCDYVTRFNVRQVAAVWNELGEKVLNFCPKLSSKYIFQLFEIAHECDVCSLIPPQLKNSVRKLLEEKAKTGSPDSKAYNRFVELNF